MEGDRDKLPRIETLVAGQIREEDFLRLCELHLAAFPKPGRTLESVIERKRPMWMAFDYAPAPGRAPLRYVVRDEADASRFVANAGTLVRTINTESGKLDVLGLLDVATSPSVRGRGYGEALVRAAWSRVDDGALDFCLFQTQSARGFYERLGARVITNPIHDTTHATEPTANPFKDAHVMVYAPRGGWPAGVIDLGGPGY